VTNSRLLRWSHKTAIEDDHSNTQTQPTQPNHDESGVTTQGRVHGDRRGRPTRGRAGRGPGPRRVLGARLGLRGGRVQVLRTGESPPQSTGEAARGRVALQRHGRGGGRRRGRGRGQG